MDERSFYGVGRAADSKSVNLVRKKDALGAGDVVIVGKAGSKIIEALNQYSCLTPYPDPLSTLSEATRPTRSGSGLERWYYIAYSRFRSQVIWYTPPKAP